MVRQAHHERDKLTMSAHPEPVEGFDLCALGG
jgi:hypothetical protein